MVFGSRVLWLRLNASIARWQVDKAYRCSGQNSDDTLNIPGFDSIANLVFHHFLGRNSAILAS